MKIHEPFNVCSLAYFLWYGSLCSTALCRTSPRRIIRLLFILVSTSGEYPYKSFMLRESRRGILLQCFKTHSDWERQETLYHCPTRRGGTYRVYVRSKCWVTMETRRLYPLIWFGSGFNLARLLFSSWKRLNADTISIVYPDPSTKKWFLTVLSSPSSYKIEYFMLNYLTRNS